MIKTPSRLLAGVLCAFALAAPVLAQSTFPNKPIEVIVPYPALAAAALEDKSGAKFNHIPFAGANPAALALMGGHIEAITVSAAEVYNYVSSGKLKLLAIMFDTRTKGFEKVPTLKEKGIDVSLGTWRGLAVAKTTPPDVVATLRAMTAKTAQEKFLMDALDKQNMGYAYADGDAFYAAMAKDHAFYKQLITKLGLKDKP